MKIISLFVCLACCLNLMADAGSSVVYKARFFLKNGERQVGYFEISGYEGGTGFDEGTKTNSFCNDNGVYELVKSSVKSPKVDSFTIYKKIHYPKYFKGTGIWTQTNYQYGAVAYEDVVIIAFRDIKFAVFISAKDNPRQWLMSELLITSNEIIDKLNNTKPLTLWEEAEDQSSYVFYNFNPKINKAEIKRLYRLKKNQLWHREGFEGLYFTQNIEMAKKWFWGKGIVILKVWGTC